MPIITGNFTTPNASKYLQQLCKHFGHKVDVTYDENAGQARLPVGTAHMAVNAEGLRISIELENIEDRPRAESIIDSHLVRFAFREDFKTMDWTIAEA